MYVLPVSGFRGLDILRIADSQQKKVLLGARLAVFEGYPHVEPPGWRLKGERKNSKFIKRP